MPIPADIQQAIQAYFAERATPDDIAALEDWFRKDDAHIRLFAEHGLTEWQMLCEHEKLDAAAIMTILREAEENAEPDFSLLHMPAFEPKPAKAKDDALTLRQVWSAASYVLAQGLRTKAGVFGSIAAVLVLGTVLYLAIFGIGNTPDQPDIADHSPSTPAESAPPMLRDTPVATLTATHNAQWAEGALAPGSRLTPNQRLTLTAGFAEITTHDGAIAILQAPATIELLDNDNAIRLHAGKLVGICETPSSKGFLVRTPHLDITDLGTRFGVDVSNSDTAEVHVWEGEVRVDHSDGSQGENRTNSKVVPQGHAIQISGQAGAMTAVPLQADRFVTTTRIVQLTGTGVSLASDETDQDWRIVAINQTLLPQPIGLSLLDNAGHLSICNNDPRYGQWLFYRGGAPRDENTSDIYTIQTTLEIPRSIDTDRYRLVADCYFDDAIIAIRANDRPSLEPAIRLHGQSLADIPSRDRWHPPFKFDVPLVELGAQHGINTIEFDIANQPGTLMALHVNWRLVPVGQHLNPQREK